MDSVNLEELDLTTDEFVLDEVDSWFTLLKYE